MNEEPEGTQLPAQCRRRIDISHLMMGDVSVYCEREAGHDGQCCATPTLEWD